MHDHATPSIPGEIATHHDRIPIYGHLHTICAVQSGSWFDVATWDEHRLPIDTDAVCIPAGLHVTLSAGVPLNRRHLRRRHTDPPPTAPPPTLAAAACLDLVIAGHLEATTGFDLTVRTITVLPQGHLQLTDLGVVTFRDGVIDTAFDPFQFGHGLICVDGKVTIEGQPKATTWATVTAEVKAGETVLPFTAIPDWHVGDHLVIPDTRQPMVPADLDPANSQVEHVVIASIGGAAVTLTAPLAHDHLAWRAQDGTPKVFFGVGNLTRSIVLASVNPAGTRAHILLTGRSDITARYAEIREMGRTKFTPLNNAVRAADGTVTPGTNQIGRYPWHFHHCFGPLNSPKPYQFEAKGLSIQGSPKWGIAIHGSHYGYVGHNVIDAVSGAGIVTETPHEYASVIERNFMVGSRAGSGQRITARSNRNDPLGDFWHGGVGLGLDSAACTIRENHIYGYTEGIGMSGFRTTPPKWPAFKGADPAVNSITHVRVPESTYWYPFQFPTNDNLVWGCWRGIETWTADSYPDKVDMFPGLTLVHCRQPTNFEDQQETTTKRWRCLGDFTKVLPLATANNILYDKGALKFKDGYEFGHTHIDGEFRGYDVAYRMQAPSNYSTFIRCTFECRRSSGNR